ncbi:MAG: ATP-dependent Clp protease ATP-binding subunit, partial [Oscillospiraceae bacterium]|nr:ATP-dependent Clp protease ATP-binding subunit [Oscillospiraceae bacterium]
MQPALCSRCKKNVAIVFVGKDENGKMEGYCLKCAKELNIRPIKDILQNMGISDDELESITDDMMEAFSAPEGMDGLDGGNDDEEDNGKTATFPFLKNIFGASQPPRPEQNGRNENAPKPEGGQSRGHKRKFLDNYCINLSARASEGKLDKMVGREEEIERVIQILNRRQKNNPCLIGEPGVGKTAIAEGLAQMIAKGDVPYKLREKEVWLLDLTSLVAGTQFRGQFESRMKGLIDEIKKQGNIILVIDEVHNIVGAGD